MNIVLASEHRMVESDSSSIFDVVQNVWSLAMVCFVVLLAKVSRHINIRGMEERVGAVRTKFRTSLPILLSKLAALQTGRMGE